VNLPRHVVDALARTTPKERVAGALEALGSAVEAFTAGKYHRSLELAKRAKNLASRDSTVREVLGLSAYRVGDWQTALAELRTYRRLAGETTHLPIEMDVLRALDRGADVTAAWQELNRRGGSKATIAEGQVVYASFLMDQGDVTQARKLTRPTRITADPHPGELRVWFVAARAAALADDPDDARRLADAIVAADPGFPGIDDLETDIRRARGRTGT
jgi:predicted Zn-dependent protease